MTKVLLLNILLVTSMIETGCSSTPTVTSPEWTHQSARTVDNGYIVYVGKGEGSNAEAANFKAEGIALEDLANECSFIPSGTRIEDRYSEKEKYVHTAYVKVAVELQDCEGARRAVEPEEIRKFANSPFTQQLKRYQDLAETGMMPDRSEVAQVEPPAEIAPAPERASGWSTTTHFYVVRQYVAYQKEIVILAPPNAYPPQAPITKQFVASVEPASRQIQEAEKKEPALRKQNWSSLPEHPSFARPLTLAPKPVMNRPPLRPPSAPAPLRKSNARQAKPARRRGMRHSPRTESSDSAAKKTN